MQGAEGERGSLHGDDRASADCIAGAEFTFKEGAEVFAGWMGAGVARGTDDGGLHDYA